MIQHVSIETRPSDVEAELGFWALLGFEPVEPPGELGERSAWAQRAGTQIHLLFAEDPVVPPQGHVAVVAEDYAGTVGRLEEAGFDVAPRQRHWGAARGYVRSPGGHLVEVMAAPPVS
jgi:catechol 2,3-dioxygenase-like lactoylglutathione lyase family enzyme